MVDWTWSFRDVRDISETNALRIEGNGGDIIRLENNVAGSVISGSSWVEGTTSAAAGESYTHYSTGRSAPACRSIRTSTWF